MLVCAMVVGATGARAVDIDPRDADIREFVGYVSEHTGRSFIVDPRVQGRVSIAGELPSDPQALFRVFTSVMRVQGFSLIDTGYIIKVVPDAVARTLDERRRGSRSPARRPRPRSFA